MFAPIVGRPLSLLLLGILLIPWTVFTARGQDKQLGNADLKKDYDAIPTKKRVDFISGQQYPQGPEDIKIMETMAQWYVYRVTWTASITNPKDMEKLHLDDRDLLTPLLGSGAAKNRAFVDQLGKPMADSFRNVLKFKFVPEWRQSILNAALMLPPVAKLKQEAVGDLLVELLMDKDRHDAVKLYAAKSMREFFPLKMVTLNDNPKDAGVKRKMERDTKRLNALVGFIERKDQPIPTDEGEREALRYMRREAVISLAQAGVPAISALKNDGEVKGPVAYELLRVLVKGKGAYNPPPSLSECVEAALGLCQLKDPEIQSDDPKAPKYDASMAVYAVGLCFLDYMTEYTADLTNMRKKFNDSGQIPTLPWRIQSERFKLAMKDLVANTLKGTPAHTNAFKLEKEVSRIADIIKTFQDVGPQVKDFRELVQTLAPKSGKLYKLKGPEIDPVTLKGGEAPADGI